MEVLFIRHGETAANQRQVYQRGAETLSSRGRAHIIDIAHALPAWEPTHLLSSPMVRSEESALLLGERLQLTPTIFPEVREVRWPAHLEGQSRRSFASMRHITSWFLQKEVHSDDARRGESYVTLRKRIERTKNILETYPNDARIVVISHSVFINFFAEHVCNTEPPSLLLAGARLLKVLTLQNSNATQFSCTTCGSNPPCPWQLTAFNKPITELT